MWSAATAKPIGPTWQGHFFLGADSKGRDVMVRLLYGGRNSLLIGVAAALATIMLGVGLGVLSGYAGGFVDDAISWAVDVIWAFPAILLGISLGAALRVRGIDLGPVEISGGSVLIPVFVITIGTVPYVVRPIRAQVRSVREQEFVLAARAVGMGPARIMAHEILPNVASTLIVLFPLIVGNAIQLEAALSFLGVGVQPTGAVVGDDDRRRRRPPHDRPAPRRGRGHAGRAHGPDAQHARRRRASSLRPARAAAQLPEADMIGFAARRLASMLLVMFALSVLVFLIFNAIPNGDPAQRIAGDQASETTVEVVRREWGFDEPLPVQYVKTMEKLFGGNLVSYSHQLDVREEIWKGMPRTLSLALGAALLWVVAGVGLAVFTALRAGGTSDRLLSGLALAGVSIPGFWLAAMMSHYLGFELGLFPNGGYVPLTEDPIQWLWHMVLPWTALAILFVGVYSRVLQVSILETMSADYVRTARAKGISERRVILRHALRNAMMPVVALWGLDVGAVIGGGAILIETIFSLQGVGQYAADSLEQLDLPPIMAVTIYSAFFIVILTTIADIVQAALDPRVRLGRAR